MKKAKKSTVHPFVRLVRSDMTLMLLGIFAAGLLLVGVYLYTTTRDMFNSTPRQPVERTYRVETAPAVIPQTSTSSSNDADDASSAADEHLEQDQDY